MLKINCKSAIKTFNKGFSLVEIIMTLLIVALILVVSFPIITKKVKKYTSLLKR